MSHDHADSRYGVYNRLSDWAKQHAAAPLSDAEAEAHLIPMASYSAPILAALGYVHPEPVM